MKQLIQECINLQDQLNKQLDENWKETRHPMDWFVAFYQELAELVDTLHWKWWKNYGNQTVDEENIKIEIVDLFHFALSFIIQNEEDPLTFTYEMLSAYDDFSIETNGDVNDLDKARLIWLLQQENCHPLSTILVLMKLFNMSKEDLIKLYILKNALNKLRYDIGYGGEYKKIWNGIEDNKYLFKLLDENIASFDDAYEKLKSIYSEIHKQ